MENTQSSKYKIVAQRYANALVQIAEEGQQWDSINTDLSNLMDLLDSNKDIENFLMNPIIPSDDKKEIIEKTLKNSLSSNVFNLLNILLDKNRIYVLPSIDEIYKTKLAQKNNVVNAQVITAIELEEKLKSRLIKKLENKLDKKVNLITNVDESIIGGVIIKVDDKIIDGSIKAKLAGLKKKLI